MTTKVIFSHVYPPIPDRRFDWACWLDGDEETGPTGYGATRDAALHDLAALVADHAEDRRAFYEAEIAAIRARDYDEAITFASEVRLARMHKALDALNDRLAAVDAALDGTKPGA